MPADDHQLELMSRSAEADPRADNSICADWSAGGVLGGRCELRRRREHRDSQSRVVMAPGTRLCAKRSIEPNPLSLLAISPEKRSNIAIRHSHSAEDSVIH